MNLLRNRKKSFFQENKSMLSMRHSSSIKCKVHLWVTYLFWNLCSTMFLCNTLFNFRHLYFNNVYWHFCFHILFDDQYWHGLFRRVSFWKSHIRCRSRYFFHYSSDSFQNLSCNNGRPGKYWCNQNPLWMCFKLSMR